MGSQQSSAKEALLSHEDRADAERGENSGGLAPLLLTDQPPLVATLAFPAKISIRGLSRLIGEATILSSVSIEVESGKVTCLIGPSGSGKSTFLRSLNRLWEPSPGTIFLDGADITALNVINLRRRVGMLFQSAALFEGTVADNVRYGPSLVGKDLSADEGAGYLIKADLDPSFSEKHIATLSGGQAQRVALARALANEPEVLLLDEPTSALDPSATIAVEKTICRLRQTVGLTVVWVSHAVTQVERVAQTVVLLVDGKVEDTFPPQELHTGQHPLAQRFAEGQLRSLKSLPREGSTSGTGELNVEDKN